MANTVKLKRSSVEGKNPTTGDLELGELALNTYDGNLFFKKDDGTASIVSVVTLDGTQTLTNKTLTSPVINNGSINNTSIGATTPAVGYFTTLVSNGDSVVTLNAEQTLTQKTISNLIVSGTITANGTAGSNGAVLTSTGTSVQWVTPTANTLDGLSDVVISAPENDQVLKFNGSVWVNAESDAAVASAVFATNAESDLGSVTDLIIGLQEDLGEVNEVAVFIYNMGQLRVDGIVSLENLDQSVKADYIAYSIIFGF